LIALGRQLDLNFPNSRARGPIGVQGLPVELDGFLGAGSQLLYRTPCDHNGREFWNVSAIADAVPFNDQRVRSDHLFSLLDTSLPQNSTISPGADVVVEFPLHNRDPALAVSEDPMVARGPDMAPACIFQRLNQIADLDGHEFMVRLSSLGRVPDSRKPIQPNHS